MSPTAIPGNLLLKNGMVITGSQRHQPAALLDQFPGAAAAYSLRNLVGTSNPAVVRVRRDNDDAEQDFTAAEVSDGTLAAWVGAGNNGFVRTWYDQSGNGNHAQQSSSVSQPQIVASGSVIMTNSKPSIQFGGGVGVMTASVSGLLTAPEFYSFSVVQPSAASTPDTSTIALFGFDLGGSNSQNKGFQVGVGTGTLSNETYCVYFSSSSTNAGRLGSTSYSHSANQQLLHRAVLGSSGFVGAKNGTAITMNLVYKITTSSNVSPVAANAISPNLHIASASGTAVPLSQKYQELVVYFSNKTPVASSIEANINAHYSIYP